MIKVIGHRGAAGLVLENTIASFEKAIDLKVDMIEIDVQATLDNKLIVFHDNTLDRLTTQKGYINHFALKDIQQLKLSDGGHIPQFEDVCKFFQQTNVPVFIEVKSPGIYEEVCKQALKYLAPENFIIGSFNHNDIAKLVKTDRSIQTAIIFEAHLYKLQEYVRGIGCDFISVGFESVNDSMVEELKSTGKKIIYWTINSINEVEKAMTYDPYGIITNYPDRIRKALNPQG